MDNHIYLLKKMVRYGGPESADNGFESGVPYNFESLGDYSKFPYYYGWNNAVGMTFPVLKFDSNNVPVGDSARMCMGVTWVPFKKRNQYDKYLDLKNLPECEMHASGKAYWEEDYPHNGVNFKLWDQIQKKGDSSCKNGIYVESTDLCFTYKVMQQVCILAKYKRDPDHNTYSWVYTGGCYENDSPVYYT